jgi:hypothetical protein
MPQRLRRRVREMAGTKFGVCVAASRSKPLAPGVDAVHLPCERGLARKRQARAAGIGSTPGIMDALTLWAERFELVPPGGRGLISRCRSAMRAALEHRGASPLDRPGSREAPVRRGLA